MRMDEEAAELSEQPKKETVDRLFVFSFFVQPNILKKLCSGHAGIFKFRRYCRQLPDAYCTALKQQASKLLVVII
jgi:hypothetical protein